MCDSLEQNNCCFHEVDCALENLTKLKRSKSKMTMMSLSSSVYDFHVSAQYITQKGLLLCFRLLCVKSNIPAILISIRFNSKCVITQSIY